MSAHFRACFSRGLFLWPNVYLVNAFAPQKRGTRFPPQLFLRQFSVAFLQDISRWCQHLMYVTKWCGHGCSLTVTTAIRSVTSTPMPTPFPHELWTHEEPARKHNCVDMGCFERVPPVPELIPRHLPMSQFHALSELVCP